MLYKYSFSILCGHLNLNKKNWIWRVTSQTDRLPVKTAGIPVRTICTDYFKFKFDFGRFPAKPVRYTGIGPHRFDRTGRYVNLAPTTPQPLARRPCCDLCCLCPAAQHSRPCADHTGLGRLQLSSGAPSSTSRLIQFRVQSSGQYAICSLYISPCVYPCMYLWMLKYVILKSGLGLLQIKKNPALVRTITTLLKTKQSIGSVR